MRTKLFIAATVAMIVAVGTVAFAGVFTRSGPTIGIEPVNVAQQSSETQQNCAEQDCCPECLACCAEDGCCWECIQFCIAMGCDPTCCFPSKTSTKAEAPKNADPCCTKPAAKTAKDCCADGCCK